MSSSNKRRTLRLRPVNFAPVEKMAFTTIGHGAETTKFRTVPPGCVLVVAAKSGNSMPSTTGDNLQLKLMDINNRQIILDPLNNQKQIYDLFGAVTIFKEGDIYPEFEYDLLEYMGYRRAILGNGDRPRMLDARVSVSGAVAIDSSNPVVPRLQNSIVSRIMFDEGYANLPEDAVDPLEMSQKFINTPIFLVGGNVPNVGKIMKTVDPRVASTTLDNFSVLNPDAKAKILSLDISKFFQFSNLPSRDWIRHTIQNLLDGFEQYKRRPILDSTLTIQNFLETIGRKCRITQGELFNVGGSGVYYNFVCRVRTNRNGALKQRIAEAEGHRKSLVRAKFTKAG